MGRFGIACAALLGLANSADHPADYATISAHMDEARMGRAFRCALSQVSSAAPWCRSERPTRGCWNHSLARVPKDRLRVECAAKWQTTRCVD